MKAVHHNYQLGSVAISIVSEVAELIHDYDLLYRTCRHDAPSAHSLNFEVSAQKRSRLGPTQFVIKSGQSRYAVSDLPALLPELEYAVNQQLILSDRRFLLFHAAAMEFQGQGFVFPADSGTGKTTLAAALLARGWNYLCDEFALIDPSTLEVHPFPKALCVKDHGIPMIETLGLPYVMGRGFALRSRFARVYVNPFEHGAIAAPVPVRGIFFLTRKNGHGSPIREPTKSESAMYFYRYGLNTAAFRQRGLETVMRAVRRARHCRLNLGTLEENVRRIEVLVGAGSEPWTSVHGPGTNTRAVPHSDRALKYPAG